MQRRSAFGVGLVASAVFGVGSLELTDTVLDSVANLKDRRQEAAACADGLPTEADITRTVPAACGNYRNSFELSVMDIPDELSKDETYYRLPASRFFLKEELASLSDQEESGELAALMGGLLGSLGGLALGYYVARGEDLGD